MPVRLASISRSLALADLTAWVSLSHIFSSFFFGLDFELPQLDGFKELEAEVLCVP
jgi:hypothetical protein